MKRTLAHKQSDPDIPVPGGSGFCENKIQRNPLLFSPINGLLALDHSMSQVLNLLYPTGDFLIPPPLSAPGTAPK